MGEIGLPWQKDFFHQSVLPQHQVLPLVKNFLLMTLIGEHPLTL